MYKATQINEFSSNFDLNEYAIIFGYCSVCDNRCPVCDNRCPVVLVFSAEIHLVKSAIIPTDLTTRVLPSCLVLVVNTELLRPSPILVKASTWSSYSVYFKSPVAL